MKQYYVWEDGRSVDVGFVAAENEASAVHLYATHYANRDEDYPHNEIYYVMDYSGGTARKFYHWLNVATGKLHTEEVGETGTTDTETALQYAGRLASAARALVGGRDLSGFPLAPANIYSIGELTEHLKHCLDAYDNFIIEWTMKND